MCRVPPPRSKPPAPSSCSASHEIRIRTAPGPATLRRARPRRTRSGRDAKDRADPGDNADGTRGAPLYGHAPGTRTRPARQWQCTGAGGEAPGGAHTPLPRPPGPAVYGRARAGVADSGASDSGASDPPDTDAAHYMACARTPGPHRRGSSPPRRRPLPCSASGHGRHARIAGPGAAAGSCTIFPERS